MFLHRINAPSSFLIQDSKPGRKVAAGINSLLPRAQRSIEL